MKKLSISKSAALALMAADKAVDRMEDKYVDNDLTPEQKAISKKMRQAGREPKPEAQKGKKSINRKPDDEKVTIVSEIAKFLSNYLEKDVEIVNPSQKISFSIGEKHYSLTLTKHNK